MLEKKEPTTIIENFLTTTLSNELYLSKDIKKITYKKQIRIYTTETVSELLSVMKANNEKPVLRFVVNTTNRALFGREKGRVISPSHDLMTGGDRCYTAGNIFLNDTFDTLIKVNHQSGGFRPSFESLKRFLAILVFNEARLPFSLPEKLIVENVNDSGGTLADYVFLVSSIKEWAETIADDALDALKNQIKEQEPIMYPRLKDLAVSHYKMHSTSLPNFNADPINETSTPNSPTNYQSSPTRKRSRTSETTEIENNTGIYENTRLTLFSPIDEPSYPDAPPPVKRRLF